MTAFDADAYRKAREPFTFTCSGRTWVARPVSAEVVAACEPDLARGDAATQRRATERLLRAAFPWRLSYWWRGDPVARILHLDVSARNAALTAFFRFLGGRAAPPPATHGTR